MERELIYSGSYDNHANYNHYETYENRRVSTSQRSARKARRRKRAAVRFMRNLILVCIIALIILGGYRIQAQAAAPAYQVQHGPLQQSQKDSSEIERIYISIQVQPGDTIWDISKQYCGSRDTRQIKSYAKAIQEINSIHNAKKLRAGSYIVVYQDVPTT